MQRSEAGQVLKADKHWLTLPHTLHHMALSQPKTDTGWQANLRHAHWQLVLSCMPPPVTGCAVICTQVQLSSHLDCRSAVFASAGLERRMRACHSASQGGNALVSTQKQALAPPRAQCQCMASAHALLFLNLPTAPHASKTDTDPPRSAQLQSNALSSQRAKCMWMDVMGPPGVLQALQDMLARLHAGMVTPRRRARWRRSSA